MASLSKVSGFIHIRDAVYLLKGSEAGHHGQHAPCGFYGRFSLSVLLPQPNDSRLPSC